MPPTPLRVLDPTAGGRRPPEPHRRRTVPEHVVLRLWASCICICALLTCFFLPACTPEPAVQPIDLEGVPVRLRPVPPVDPMTGQRPEVPPVRWVMRTVSVPLTRSLEPLWAQVNQGRLPALSREVWARNGLRVGTITASQFADLEAALGPVEQRFDSDLLHYGHPEPLRESPPLAADFFVDLTIPPQEERLVTVDRGRLRLLASSRGASSGGVLVELIPQQYLPRVSLTPRSPLEKVLDGRVFSEIGITLRVGRDEVLVLGYAPPPEFFTAPSPDDAAQRVPSRETPATAENPGTLPGTPPGTPPGNAPDAPLPPPPVPPVQPNEVFHNVDARSLPLTLGRGLLTLGRAEDDLQLLILLRPLP